MEPSPSAERTTNTPKKGESFWELIRFIIVAILIVVPIRLLIAQPFIVSGSSMFPTFKDHQYLIVDQITYRLEEPKRGDVVIFRFPLDTSKFFIKRLIGLPGETVIIDKGVVSIVAADGTKTELEEPYLEQIGGDSMSISLNENEYFVLGDNRTASSDSRVWGVLPKDNIVGRAFVRLLPVDTLGLHPGEHRFISDE